MTAPTAHELEVLAVRARRVARLTGERGWLAMVDRIWLEPGDNDTPLGVVHVGAGASLALRGPVPSEATRGGAALVAGPLAMGDELVLGGRRYEVGRAGERPCLRVWDPAAPARAAFAGLAHFPIDPRWRVEARLEPRDPPAHVAMPFSNGDIGDRESPGVLRFTLEGRALSLLPTIEAEPSPRLFLLFADDTNADETYGAGRLLYAPMPVDGHTVLDFNLALNPACAFNDLVVCPLPPRENRLPLRVEAGEKRMAR